MDTALLLTAREAALTAGGFIRGHFGRDLNVDAAEAHDIKLELDRRSQGLISSSCLIFFSLTPHTSTSSHPIPPTLQCPRYLITPSSPPGHFSGILNIR